MDMLYARYSSPMDLISTYINRGRFGDFIKGFLQTENERRKAEADKDEDLKMWMAYVHSYSDKSFNDWKAGLMGGSTKTGRKTGGDYDLDEKRAQEIIDNLFPGRNTNG